MALGIIVISLAVFSSTVVTAIQRHPLANQASRPLKARINETPGHRTAGYISCVDPSDRDYTGTYPIRDRGRYYRISDTNPHFDKGIAVELDIQAAAFHPVDMIDKRIASNDSFPYIGAVLLSNNLDLSADSFSFAHIGRVNKTERGHPGKAKQSAPGSPPVLTYCQTTCGFQSSIWRYNPQTEYIYPEWVNLQGVPVRLYAFYLTESEIMLTGDWMSLLATFPKAKSCLLRFKTS